MNAGEFRDYWAGRNSSGHRGSEREHFREKAQEHALLLSEAERAACSVDLGCGAGELLAHLKAHVNVVVGLDYSKSMLEAAGRTLAGTAIELLSEDVFAYLPRCEYPVWMTCEALNQYLDSVEMNRVLDIFIRNVRARSLILFDCVDPVRYLLIPHGIRYLPEPQSKPGLLRSIHRRARRTVHRARVAALLACGALEAPVQPLRSAGMGYGYLPGFWLCAAATRELDIEIRSSRHYEYRYHVALRKRP